MTGRSIKYVFLLGLVTACALSVAQDDPEIQKKPICEAAFTVAARGAKEGAFIITESMRLPKLEGKFRATGGMSNSIEVWVLDDDEFVNWSNHHSVKSLYNSDKVTQGTIEVYLRRPGKYHVVFNNMFSLMTPKAVEANLILKFRQVPVAGN
ncbi:MAG: hypothetical protein ACLQBK_02860 [Candidatus Sulfotelmatobacter sp.]